MTIQLQLKKQKTITNGLYFLQVLLATMENLLQSLTQLALQTKEFIVMNKLAEKKGCSSREFATQFLHQNPKQDYFFLKQKPCIFLAESRCTIYESRPDSCADYPHLQSPGQKFRFGRTIEQAGTCSIVFHVLEEIYEKLI